MKKCDNCDPGYSTIYSNMYTAESTKASFHMKAHREGDADMTITHNEDVIRINNLSIKFILELRDFLNYAYPKES